MSLQQQQQSHDENDKKQNQELYIIRHGDRWDYSHPEWLKTAQRRGDPPLSSLGHQQARETGILLHQCLAERHITWLSSPFLRCLQTSNDAINMIQFQPNDNLISILPEYSVFEMDGNHGGKLHKDLPPLEERKQYFARIDLSHESMFIPELPESRIEFITRCDRVIESLNQRYPYRPNSAIVIVTHAAGCVAMARAAAQCRLDEVNAAGPCSIMKLTRTSNTPVWKLDAHNDKNGWNGTMRHISVAGTKTIPWNHFGDKGFQKGYTGPPKQDDDDGNN